MNPEDYNTITLGDAQPNAEQLAYLWRQDFPALQGEMNGKPLAYLDSASSAQKPYFVTEAMRLVMEEGYANIHRGLYEYSQTLTQAYEDVRKKAATFINAQEKEIIFTRNTTEAINLVAQAWGRMNLREGDEVILTEMEHHANLVPWQLLRDQTGITLKFIPVLDDGTLDMAAYETLLNEDTRLVAFAHTSNAFGTINPAAPIIEMARAYNPDIVTLVDASQAAVHGALDVKALDCDFLAFTGHKLYGPTGVGVLYGRYDVLEEMAPYQGGGDMIETVELEYSTFKAPPYKFEAGTPAIIEVIGLGAAIDYISTIGFEAIAAHEAALSAYLKAELEKIPGLHIFGPQTPEDRIGVYSFIIEGLHTSDITMILDQCGVAVRSGHHCCMPLMQRFGIEGTIRASLGLYSNKDDVDALIAGLTKARDMLQ